MARTHNKTFGYCSCPWGGCQERAHVRRIKDHERGDLYGWCPKHGRFMDDPGKAYVKAEAEAGRVEWLQEPQDETPAPVVEVTPAPAAAPAPSKRRGFFAWLNDFEW